MREWVAGAVLAMGVASGANAADRTAAGAILAGKYIEAEHTLATERRIFPNRPEIMLNLAAVYRQTGRDDAARALYADVLNREPVQVDMARQRTTSSHQVAQAGLARMTRMAAR